MTSIEKLSTRGEALALRRQLAEREAVQDRVTSASLLQREVIEHMDRDVFKSIERRHGEWIRSERLAEGRLSKPASLLREEYTAHLQQKYGVDRETATRVYGHYDTSSDRITVTMTHPITAQVLAHERIHQLADPRVRSTLGRSLDEGLTEWLARDAAGTPQFVGQPEVWGNARQLTEMMQAHVGEDTLKKAYFQGDVSSLKRSLDGVCGEGTLSRVASLADAGRYDEARKLLGKNAEAS